MLHAGPNAMDLVPGAVRPLLEADLPLVLWWTTDPTPHEQLFRDLGDECSRLILDLPDPGTSAASLRLGLDPAICPYSRDTCLVRPDPLARAGRPVFRPLLSSRDARTGSIPSRSRRSRPARRPRPDWHSGWRPGWPGSSGGSRKGQPVNQTTATGCVVPGGVPGPARELAVEIATREPAGEPAADALLLA